MFPRVSNARFEPLWSANVLTSLIATVKCGWVSYIVVANFSAITSLLACVNESTWRSAFCSTMTPLSTIVSSNVTLPLNFISPAISVVE